MAGTIVTGALAGVALVGVVVLAALGQPIPTALEASTWALVGATAGTSIPRPGTSRNVDDAGTQDSGRHTRT